MIEFERATKGLLAKGDYSIYNEHGQGFILEIGLEKNAFQIDMSLPIEMKLSGGPYPCYTENYSNSFSYRWKQDD